MATKNQNTQAIGLAETTQLLADVTAERDALQARIDNAGPAFTTEAVCQLLARAENNCSLTLSLHGLLKAKGLDDLARLAWLAYANSSAAAEMIGDVLEVEASIV